VSVRKPRKKTAFVPRVVFRTAVAGASVVPLCVMAGLSALGPGCGGSAGVAAECFCNVEDRNSCCYEPPVDAGDAGRDVNIQHTPDASDTGIDEALDAEDGSSESGDEEPPSDAPTVADVAFSDASEGGGGG
jgi:hypothetical protein